MVNHSKVVPPSFEGRSVGIGQTDGCIGDGRFVLSSVLRENETKEYFDKHFGIILGKKLMMPTQYLPNRDFMAYHRDKVFVK